MNLIRRIIRPNSFLNRKRKYILIFLNGFLLALLMFFFIQKQYENNIFASLATYIHDPAHKNELPGSNAINNEDSLLIKSVRLVHELTNERSNIFGPHPIKGINATYLQPVSFDLMTGQGVCGSNAYILGRLLQEMNIDVRFPQMTVNGQHAGHILIEAKTSYGWVVLDAASNTFFRKPNGQLAGFNDVKNNWNYFKDQLPADYNMAYRYEGVRYTNWDKIPLVMPLIKNVMYWTIGKEKTDNYSLRNLVLQKYNILFNITLGVYLLVILFSINLLIKARRKKAALSNNSNASFPVQPAI